MTAGGRGQGGWLAVGLLLMVNGDCEALNILGAKYAKTMVGIINTEAVSPPWMLGCCSAIIKRINQ